MLDCDISGSEIQVTAVMMIGFTPPTLTPRCLQYFATVTLNLPDYDTRYISDLISLHCLPQTEDHCHSQCDECDAGCSVTDCDSGVTQCYGGCDPRQDINF